METEYIEKQVAIKELCETYEHEYPTASGAFDEYATRIVPNVLRNLPPADVRPVVRSEWVLNDNRTWSCKLCHSWIPDEQRYYANYCMFCGADMRGGDADGDEKD